MQYQPSSCASHPSRSSQPRPTGVRYCNFLRTDMTGSSSAPLPTADFGTRFSALHGRCGRALRSAMGRLHGAVATAPSGWHDDDRAMRRRLNAICEGPSTMLWVLLTLFLLASTIGYHAIFEGRYGATPGKRWLGLAVVDPDGSSPIGLAAGTLRSVIRQSFWLSLFFVLDASPLSLGLPSALFFALPLLTLGVFLLGAFSPSGRAAHDLVPRTGWCAPIRSTSSARKPHRAHPSKRTQKTPHDRTRYPLPLCTFSDGVSPRR